MKRKVWTIWLVCLLAFSMVFPVYAAQETEDAFSDGIVKEAPFAGFVLENKLYAFFEAGEDVTVTILNNAKIDEKAYPLTDSGQYVHYFILLDVSGSVRRVKDQIEDFVMKLIEDTEVKTLVTVMTLGESFDEVIAASMEDDAVKRALNQISYADQTTNLYKGIDSAINYIDEKERSRGDLYRLILITDGSPDGITEKPKPEAVKQRVEARTDIVFDVIGIGNWNQNIEKELPMSGRKAAVVKDRSQAVDAAEELAAETNNLYSVCFELSQPVQRNALDIRLWLRGSESDDRILEQQNLTVIGNSEMPGVTDNPQEEEELQDTDDGTQADREQTPDKDEAQILDKNISGSEIDSISDKETFVQKIKENLPVYGAFFLGGIVLCVVVIIILRKLMPGKGEIASNHLRVEVISGRYGSKKKDFSLEHTLLIGSEKKCDIIFMDPDVAGQNTRIFVHEGTVCIEDLNSICGTVIGGMRIFAPNRLRSGDIVSIGNRVQFRIFFNMQ
ncbi:MAG: FHA domain-containing protein [Blautia sp.]|nr:FHA domain-containing protein [Lachnoclostridium sp.]MCM1212301.1 FHA domain-containing protein [Blautia sp.]